MGWSLFGGKKSGGTAPATKAQPAAATKGKAQAAPPAKGKTPATPAKTATPGAPGNDPNIKKASVCGDGISIANFERLSYEQWKKKAGNENKTIQDWRNAVVSALRNAKEGDAMVKYDGVSKISDTHADIFHSVADSFTDPKTKQTSYTSTESLENLFTGKVPGLTEFGSNKGYHSHRMPFWRYLKQKGLAYEGFWQHETSASWVNEAGKTIYADPSEIPYLVSNVAPIGTWVKVSTVDKDGNVLKSTYARILERGTNKAESSLKVYQNLGFSNVTPNADPTDWLKVETFEGSGDGKLDPKAANSYFSNDEMQRAGAILDKAKAEGKPLPPMKTRDDLKKAEGGGQQQAAADPGVPGGNRLEKGFPTVAIGSNTRLVGYACEDCYHDGGGYVIEGSSTVYVGKYPFARIGDATNDALAVATGDETVFVGGTPTTATLA